MQGILAALNLPGYLLAQVGWAESGTVCHRVPGTVSPSGPLARGSVTCLCELQHEDMSTHVESLPSVLQPSTVSLPSCGADQHDILSF